MDNILYPLSRDEHGNAMWKVLHSYAASLPEKLNSSDKKRFKSTLFDLVDRYPCTDCQKDGLDYIKKNQPKSHTKQGYFDYICEFHNYVNQKTGKPLQNCGTMMSPSCPTCVAKVVDVTDNSNKTTAPDIEKKQSKIDQIIDYRLNQQMGDFKNASIKIVEKMSQNAGLDVPEMTFSEQTPCSDPSTSCTHMPVDPVTNKLLPGTKIHFNVHQYSPRTAVHEATHYIKKAKGLDAFDEKSVESDSRAIISRDFPVDAPGVLGHNIREYRDTPFPTDKDYIKTRIARRLSTVQSSLPYFSKYYKGAKEHKAEQPAPQVVPTMTYSDGRPVYPTVPTQPEPPEPASVTEGFTSMLNPIYAPFANLLGLKPEDVNNAHTPALLANGAIVLAESNLNKFGSMAISLLASVVTLAAGTLTKDSIGYADKKLLVGLGGAFLWSGALRYILNPKIHEEVIGEAMDFGQSLAVMDAEAMVGSVTGDAPKEVDPEKQMMKGGSAFPKNLHRNISAPLGGGVKKIQRGRTSEIDSSDIYEDPDATISSQGTFRRSDPFFPSV